DQRVYRQKCKNAGVTRFGGVLETSLLDFKEPCAHRANPMRKEIASYFRIAKWQGCNADEAGCKILMTKQLWAGKYSA
ncbi:MAG TPA: hypothetical protein VG897_15485, partial [Terriglobales bacterium]|nr:hypothetical protein [Terriglobales bacterium]